MSAVIAVPTTKNRGMRFARYVFFGYMALLAILYFAGLPLALDVLQTPCTSGPCPSVQLPVEDFAQLVASGASPSFYAVYITIIIFLLDTLTGAVMAILLVKRRPNDPVALLLAIPMASHSFNFMSHPAILQMHYPWLWPITLLPRVGITVFWMLAFSLLPDGKWVPRWSRWLVPYVAVLGLFVYFGHLFLPADVWNEVIGATFMGNFIVLTGFQIWRYYRAAPNQRVRLRWVVAGILSSFLIIAVAGALEWLIPELARIGSPAWFTFYPITISSPIVMYLCIWVAVLRDRLFDLDIIIRRTLIYGLLSAILALFYFGSVVVLQQIFRGISGPEPDVAIILSTLAIAALFSPIRHRIQIIIDRRFYRSKYDAAKAQANFAIHARDEVDISRLVGAFIGVVEETLGPEHLSLWLKDTEKLTQVRGSDYDG